jgi:hypothetical protein
MHFHIIWFLQLFKSSLYGTISLTAHISKRKAVAKCRSAHKLIAKCKSTLKAIMHSEMTNFDFDI